MGRRAARALGLVAVVVSLSALPVAPALAATPDDVTSQLETVRKATEKYQDPAVAVADGYVATDVCYGGPLGIMGYHYFHPELGKTGHTDIAKPPLMIYQPGPEGERVLVAVEWFKPDDDQDLNTDDDRPWLFGVPFDGPMEGHEPGMPRHFDLHAWIYQKNPQGVFAPYNPAGTCEGATELGGPIATATPGAGHGAHSGHATATPAAAPPAGPAQVGMVPVGGAATGSGVTAEERAKGWYFGLAAAGASAAALIVALAARRRRA